MSSPSNIGETQTVSLLDSFLEEEDKAVERVEERECAVVHDDGGDAEERRGATRSSEAEKECSPDDDALCLSPDEKPDENFAPASASPFSNSARASVAEVSFGCFSPSRFEPFGFSPALFALASSSSASLSSASLSATTASDLTGRVSVGGAGGPCRRVLPGVTSCSVLRSDAKTRQDLSPLYSSPLFARPRPTAASASSRRSSAGSFLGGFSPASAPLPPPDSLSWGSPSRLFVNSNSLERSSSQLSCASLQSLPVARPVFPTSTNSASPVGFLEEEDTFDPLDGTSDASKAVVARPQAAAVRSEVRRKCSFLKRGGTADIPSGRRRHDPLRDAFKRSFIATSSSASLQHSTCQPRVLLPQSSPIGRRARRQSEETGERFRCPYTWRGSRHIENCLKSLSSITTASAWQETEGENAPFSLPPRRGTSSSASAPVVLALKSSERRKAKEDEEEEVETPRPLRVSECSFFDSKALRKNESLGDSRRLACVASSTDAGSGKESFASSSA